MCRRPASARNPRRGSMAFEALLVIPVVLLVLTTAVEFGLLVAAEQVLVDASAKAARVRALGGTEDQMTEAVRQVLGQKKYAAATIIYNDCNNKVQPGELVIVRIELPTSAAAPIVLDLVGSLFLGQTLVGQTAMPKE